MTLKEKFVESYLQKKIISIQSFIFFELCRHRNIEEYILTNNPLD